MYSMRNEEIELKQAYYTQLHTLYYIILVLYEYNTECKLE